MTAELKPSRDPADAQLYDEIGFVLHGTRQIAAYMGVSPASIVRWRRSFRGREEPRLCFPAMLIPGRGRQWRMVTNTRSIARWMERWAEIDTGNAQAKARWRRKPPKTKRLDETQTAVVRVPLEGESRPSLREASQSPKEPCPCGVPSRCLVHNESPLEKEGPRPIHEEPPKPAPVDPTPRANQKPAMFRPEGCMCGKGLMCSVHD
jgi:hypothetical protein